MRQIVQGSVKTTPVVANAKFLIIRGRKAETVYFPTYMSLSEVRELLVARQEITREERVIKD